MSRILTTLALVSTLALPTVAQAGSRSTSSSSSSALLGFIIGGWDSIVATGVIFGGHDTLTTYVRGEDVLDTNSFFDITYQLAEVAEGTDLADIA